VSNVPILDVHPGTGKGKAAGDYQRALDPDVAHRDGYRGVIVKFSQGDGTYDPYNLDGYWRRMARVFEHMGGYHFLDHTMNGRPQAQRFVKRMRLATGREDGRGIAIVIDFERYSGPGFDLSPTNEDLHDFVKELREHVGRHLIGVYSNHSFWTGGTPSGRIADYDIDYVYDSRYPYDPNNKTLSNPIRSMREALDWYWKQPKWGGKRPVVWQGSGAGWVGDVVCDGNLLFVPFDELTRR
jgi:hypothetical protein